MVGRIRRFPRFSAPATTSPERAPCAVDRHVHRGSAPRVSHPLGGFLAGPGFAAFTRPSRSRPFRSQVTCRYRAGPSFPFRAPPAGIAHPFRGRWLPRRSVHAAFECDPSCPDLPGLPPTPASFRPTFTRSAECDLVRPRVRQTSAQWPVSLQGSSDVSTGTGAPTSSSPAGTACRAHPRSAPSTSERSSSRVPDSLPRRRHRLVGRGPPGVLPSRAFLRLVPRALTDLPGGSRSGGPGARSRRATDRGCDPVRRVGRSAVHARSRLHDDSTCRQRGRCVARAGPPRGGRPLPPRP